MTIRTCDARPSGGLRILAVGLGLIVLLSCPFVSPARAETFAQFLAALWPEAEALGVSRATFDAAFRGVEPDYSIPDLVKPGAAPKADNRGQAEFTRAPSQYLDRAYLNTLATQGRPFLSEHKAALDTIERDIGVDRYSLLAIWGRETAFGNYTLPHDAIRVLATQAYTGRRKELFRAEILAALQMLQSGVPRGRMRSSWAGAVGLTQFMPTEYQPFARDIDGDGSKDIFSSVADALGSSAAQLAGKGWVKGQTWGYEVRIPPTADCAYEGPTQARPIAEWAKLGFVRTGKRPWTPDQLALEAYLMSPAGAYGPSFLVLENYKVIRRYNTSDLYAVFVGHLADRLGGGGDFETPWGGIAAQKTAVIEEIQKRLQGLGFEVDKIDGKIGSN
ncbi:MAG: lytic murein transglycosylase, partial [Hyphomicrobium sp.]